MRVAVAEDVLLMRQGIVAAVSSGGHDVIWEVERADLILLRCRQDPPDVLITDVRMPPDHADDGLRAALNVRAELPDIGILVLSQYIGNEYARKLLGEADNGRGGTGYLLKESVGRVSQFLAAIEQIGGGGVSIDPKVISHLLLPPVESTTAALSPRQHQVLELIAQGKTNAHIAAELFVSPATLERTISQIFMALDLSEVDGNRRVLAVLEYLKQ